MISSIVLLSLGVFATPITISEVTATREGDRLVVDVAGDAMVDPEAASAKAGNGALYLYLRDTRVRANNRSWGEGDAAIRAHRHRGRVELVVPVDQLGGCRGPVEFEKSKGGLRAVIGCDGATRPSPAARKPAASALPAAAPAPVVTPESAVVVPGTAPALPTSADPQRAARENDQLKAVLALKDVPPVIETAPAPPALVAVDLDAKPAAKGGELAANRDARPIPAPPGPAAGTDTVGAAQKPASSGGSGGVALAGVLLLGLAGAAFYFSRRRATITRFITIVETANLGPKRSIIVARIGDETLVLGASEAGITLLRSHTDAKAELPTTAVTGDKVADAWFQSDSVTPPMIPDVDVDAGADEISLVPQQGGLLARLFKRAKPANESEAALQGFEELLEDSIEDQELRRKLSMGMSGRVA